METISFVIPCYRSEQTLPAVLASIRETMAAHPSDAYEVVLVNDASPDGTWGVIRQACADDARVSGISLVRNFGQHAALMAGLRQAKGDYVVCLDDDGQTPASEAYLLIDKAREGFDGVYAAYHGKKHSAFRNFGSWVNSKMMEHMLGKPPELYVSSYFVLARRIVDEVVKYANPYPYVMGLVLRTTNKLTSVPVRHRERLAGRSGYTFGKLLGLWCNGFTAFSIKPLRIATLMGALFALLGFGYAIYAFVNHLCNPGAPLGWTSLVIILLVLGGLILLVLGMMGEYLGRIYICLNNAPQYVVRERAGGRGREG